MNIEQLELEYNTSRDNPDAITRFSSFVEMLHSHTVTRISLSFEDQSTSYCDEFGRLFLEMMSSLPLELQVFKLSLGSNVSFNVNFSPLLNFTRFVSMNSLVEVNLNSKRLSRHQLACFWKAIENSITLQMLDVWFNEYLPCANGQLLNLNHLELWESTALEHYLIFRFSPKLALVPGRLMVHEKQCLDCISEMKFILSRNSYISEYEAEFLLTTAFQQYFRDIQIERPSWDK